MDLTLDGSARELELAGWVQLELEPAGWVGGGAASMVPTVTRVNQHPRPRTIK